MSDPPIYVDRKPRILHVLRAPLGGPLRHVLDLARQQIALGHDVGLVVDPLAGDARLARQLDELEPSMRLGIKRLPMPRQPHFGDIGAIFQVALHARKLGVDVIHGHGPKGGLYARVSGLLARGDAVRCYTPHGGSFHDGAAPLVQAVLTAVEWLLAKRTDVLLFESVFIANSFHQRIGDTQASVRIAPYGISPADFVPVTPNADAADFLCVGEMRSAAGIDTLIDAIGLLTARSASAPRLVIVGSGPDQAKLAARAAQRGVRAQVSFIGAMPARQAFALGRILVVPSRSEPLPYTVLEAAGAQVPMVATDVSGIGEIFGPTRDRLIARDDPVALAEAMETMLETDHQQARREAEDLASFVATRFTIATMADAVIAGYHEGLARRPMARTKDNTLAALPRPAPPFMTSSVRM